MRATLVAQLCVDKVRRRRAAIAVLRRLGAAVDVLVVIKVLGLCAGIFGEFAVVAVGLGSERVVGDDAGALVQPWGPVTKVDLSNMSIRHIQA